MINSSFSKEIPKNCKRFYRFCIFPFVFDSHESFTIGAQDYFLSFNLLKIKDVRTLSRIFTSLGIYSSYSVFERSNNSKDFKSV